MSREQIDAALALAQSVKSDRALLRARVTPLEYEDGRYELATTIEDPANRAALRSMPVPKLLRWVKRLYSMQVERILAVAGCSEYTTFGGLTERQITALARALRLSPEQLAAAAEDVEIKRWAQGRAA